MSYIVSDLCLICGKAKGYTRYGISDTDVPPEICTCNKVLLASNIAHPVYPYVCLIPENMQELETMIRRVVHEEVSVFFEEDEEEPENATPSPFIGRD